MQPSQPPSGFDASSAPALTALSLTHILYDPASPISFISAYLSLLPQVILVIFGSIVYSTREIEVLLFLIGQLLSEAINVVLKKWFRQHRPGYLVEIGALREGEGRGYGMPSSHGQFMGFFAVYCTLLLLVRLPGSTHRSAGWQRFKTGLYLVAAWGVAGAVGLARVQLRYHTLEQVAAGLGAGMVLGLGWFIVTAVARKITPFWDFGMSLWGFFWGRDLMMHTDIVEDGYRTWQEHVARKKQ
ncbi:PAP2-domain-containing protein [Ascobolus immersus RN42]|uniref:Dolichyldiphosphatase n=1 Tax=Ascobolus immersus RN42 TaxID=1160509 RepID=A0A3N4HX68_ASCIM|nr:PAP2-domain-containing protein [Ascobolus immersus RN42]